MKSSGFCWLPTRASSNILFVIILYLQRAMHVWLDYTARHAYELKACLKVLRCCFRQCGKHKPWKRLTFVMERLN